MNAEEFERARKRLWDELVNLHDAWGQYRYLYGHSDERIRMLNACAQWFFGLVQRLLLREVILGISRLTDPPETGRFSNLVLATLLVDPAVGPNAPVGEKLRGAIDDAIDAAEPIRAHRNKYIAHLDHATAIGARDEPLPGLRRTAISDVITKMEAAYNIHGSSIRHAHTIFELKPMGSSNALVDILEKSERWRKWRELNDENPE